MKSSSSYLKYVDIGLEVDSEKNVVATYLIEKAVTSRLDGLAFLGSVAAESSTGTWTDVKTATAGANLIAGKVFAYDPAVGIAKIAYPIDLFEPGNISQLLTVIAGNAFGLADVSKLKLMDISLPKMYLASYLGPKHGIKGVYERLKIEKNIPIIGSIIKPKCGLTASEHAEVCFDAWSGLASEGGTHGVDMVKDDEALTHQPAFGSDFYTRIRLSIDAMKRAEDISGRKKIYVPNVTSSNVLESIKRADFVARLGGDAIMIDFVMGGCSLLHTLRNQDLGLIIHGHRTLFAALHRAQDFGVDYMVWAKLFRVIGGDQVHTGTPAIGVMSSKKAAVLDIVASVTEATYLPSTSSASGLAQDFDGLRSVLPICGAGLDPLTTEKIVKELGPRVALFAGGGVHGHPGGTRAGAASLRESVEAVHSGTSFEDFAATRNVPWLNEALKHFGAFDKQSPNSDARVNM